jgi:hypothetical protein
MIFKTQHNKLRIEQHEPHSNGGELKVFGRTINCCSTIDTHPVSVKGQLHYMIWRSFWTHTQSKIHLPIFSQLRPTHRREQITMT